MLRWKKRRRKRPLRISVSPAFPALLLLFAAWDRQGLLVHILLAAVLHECGHLLVLRLLGGEIGGLRLTLFGAELRIRRSERLSYGRELAAVLAGPAVNVFCSLALGRAAAAMGARLPAVRCPYAAGAVQFASAARAGWRAGAVFGAVLALGTGDGGACDADRQRSGPVRGAAFVRGAAGRCRAPTAAADPGRLVPPVLVPGNGYCQTAANRVKYF